MNDDYILRIIESIGEFAGKVLFNKQSKEFKNIDVQSMTIQDVLPILLKKLVFQGKYNEAENLLFEELEKNPSNDLIKIGKDFYNILLLKSDEDLTKANFSREEIFQGLNDMKKFTCELIQVTNNSHLE
ncbi:MULTISPECIES: DUF6483 family protein [Clostridium]|uniref:Uncharacterized protein n=1 Tax=Clostridium ragsdalei P11 TaxID=1353534 RepID=A0A1A6AKY4_9CLOT|nr:MULTISPECIES: DUF6483 family protein [Clostridium]AZV56632.1 hypothetical protein DMR38_08475 [Clostridium sp. AWRP]OBR90745.1 hypothetical protein CLRAG_33930 [Clostridium ragsdalei P11]QXE20819.1 hypothetical protein B5S50_19255 [Clostridium sp. 001]